MQSISKTCSFFGHRVMPIENELKLSLTNRIESLVLNGYEKFLFCSGGSFLSQCKKTVDALKAKYPQIRRIYITDEQEQKSNELQGQALNEQFDEVLLISTPKPVELNRFIETINMSDFCLFYVVLNYGTAHKALMHAKLLNKHTYNFGDFPL